MIGDLEFGTTVGKEDVLALTSRRKHEVNQDKSYTPNVFDTN